MKKLFCIIAVLFLMAGCDVKNDVAMKIGDIEVKNKYVDYFAQSFNTQSGGTVSETVRKKAFYQAEIYAQMISVCDKMNLDTNKSYDETLKNIEKTFGSAQEYMQTQNVEQDLFDFVLKGDAARQVLFEEFKREIGITPEVEDEYFKQNFWRAKHLLLLTEGKTDDEKKELQKQIRKLYNRAVAGEDFGSLIAEYNEDPGVESNPNGYVFTTGEMVREFQEAVAESDVGEYKIVETSYGYHLVKRLALDESDVLYESLKKSKLQAIDSAIVMDEYFRGYFWRAKHILFSTQGKSASEKEEIKRKAEEVFELVVNGENFDAMIRKYNEDPGVEGAPDGYVFTNNEMVKEFQDGVSQIDVGAFNIVKTDYGYHVINRLPLDETPELYRKFKTDSMQKLANADGANINDAFSDYILDKIAEYDIETRDFTGLSKKVDK